MRAALLLWFCLGSLHAQEADRFLWSQLKVAGNWDPYPGVHREVLSYLSSVTSVLSVPDRRTISLKDPELFSTPFLVLAGREAPPALDEAELGALRDYLISGGFLWIEDTSGVKSSPFDRWVRKTLKVLFPDSELKPLKSDNVLFRTFFFMRRIGGRVMVSGSVEGVDWGGNLVVVYSQNDILGAWAKDPLGHYLHECLPGGEAQRMDARKLAVNIVMYALTGNYKSDAVHQPFLLEKLRTGGP